MRQRGEHLEQEEKKGESDRPKTGAGSTMARRPKQGDRRFDADGGKEAERERI